MLYTMVLRPLCLTITYDALFSCYACNDHRPFQVKRAPYEVHLARKTELTCELVLPES